MSLSALIHFVYNLCLKAVTAGVRRRNPEGARTCFCWQTIGLALSVCCAPCFAADFSAPLQDVQVSVNGQVVTYQVFDPERGAFVQQSATMPPGFISNPTTNGGVVAWLAGNTVY